MQRMQSWIERDYYLLVIHARILELSANDFHQDPVASEPLSFLNEKRIEEGRPIVDIKKAFFRG